MGGNAKAIVKGGGKQFSKPVKSPLYNGSLDRRRI